MNLVAFAHENGQAATKSLDKAQQKKMGQFMTPPAIARLMAKRACSGISTRTVHVLEPAAGCGVLAAAAVEELISNESKPAQICLTLFEADGKLLTPLKQLADRMRRAGQRHGVNVSVRIRIEDFLLSDTACDRPTFDLIIANPPYFKLNKRDRRATIHNYAVYGQPNIYGIFMAACSRLLTRAGRWCFITPRSWTNGTYFASARRQVLTRLHIDSIHIFESREEHFTDDEILQEAMITWATAQAAAGNMILLSTSEGISDLDTAMLRSLPATEIIANDSNSVISLPLHGDQPSPVALSATLGSLGIKVSTGPVVAFRASKYLYEKPGGRTVPLLWMQHITPMRVSWPIKKKREHIVATAETAWMLVPNENMVVMRRFSPKEDLRRAIAAPYMAHTLHGPSIGLENHTNYFYRPGGSLTTAEAIGLAAFLNSRIADRYLRSISGNTQVNASDLREMPLPSRTQLIAIGDALLEANTPNQVDSTVEQILVLPSRQVA